MNGSAINPKGDQEWQPVTRSQRAIPSGEEAEVNVRVRETCVPCSQNLPE